MEAWDLVIIFLTFYDIARRLGIESSAFGKRKQCFYTEHHVPSFCYTENAERFPLYIQ